MWNLEESNDFRWCPTCKSAWLDVSSQPWCPYPHVEAVIVPALTEEPLED